MMPPGRGQLVTRTTLMLALALGGVLLGTQSRLVTARLGSETYLVLVLLLAVALAALARPSRRS